MTEAILEGEAEPRPPLRAGLRALAIALLCLSLGFMPEVAQGHGGVPRLLVTPARVNPGGVVDVRVEDVGADASVVLAMTGGSESRLELARAQADAEGHLTAALSIPVDLPIGRYDLEAIVDGVPPLLATVSVEGSPIGPGGEPGAKDEDDLLLIALPADWQRSLSGPIVTARPLTETLPAGSASQPPIWALLVLLVAGGIAGLVGVAGIRRRSARGQPAPGRGSRLP